ncbi:MAG: hypothetical protein HW416_2793 [Chloroflexi bacterium]|nr:hypothetical protein [Chloroflexota bacterium]
MLDDQRPGTIYWIDHYVVATDDVERWVDFHERVLGAKTILRDGRNLQRQAFQDLAGPCHHGAFRSQPLPVSAGLGKGLPRHGLFIRQEDIEKHLRRLDDCSSPHTDPFQTSAEGDEGIAIRWEDPDGNQFEFWAPDRMPEGGMVGSGPLGIGRISHGVYECRDLQRTADLFNRYCSLEPLSSADVPSDTLVLPLAAGGRIVFKQVETLGRRTCGWGTLNGPHAALVVRDEDFFPNYEKMWAELPDWAWDADRRAFIDGGDHLPARMARHGGPGGSRWYEMRGRGDDWYDWDTNCFHFFGGAPKGGSMADYEPHSMDYFAKLYAQEHALGA